MLFDTQASITEQRQQKTVLLKALNEIAEQPITASPVQRDTLQQQLIQFIYKQPFDSLYGGLVLQKESRSEYFKPKETNQLLSEIFTKADQVFYHGLFSYTAKKIDDCLTKADHGLKKLIDFPACFTINELNTLLDNNENKLLQSLIHPAKITLGKENFFISYSQPLKDAALRIDMHYKEAQILEFSIQNKLISQY